MKLSDYIAGFLAERGCTHVFGYAGGAITHLIDSLYQRQDLHFIGTYHEQGAAFAAEGYARRKNDLGVAIATSGPGATNLLTGIGSAYFDSIPCLYLTGQVNTYEYKGALPVRQLGFQETDIVSIVKPITKYAVRIIDPLQIRYELEKAISIATSGRKGPVLLDIPMDIQRANVDDNCLCGYPEKPEDRVADFSLAHIMELLGKAQRPVILVGGGVRLSSAQKLFNQMAKQLEIPIVCSLMGRDVYDNTNDNYFGMIGAYGNRYANLTIANSDFILALGTRLDSRQTGTASTFAREAKLVRVDIDRNELDKKIKKDEYAVHADIGYFLHALNEKISQLNNPAYSSWLEQARTYRQKYPSVGANHISDPNFIMSELSKITAVDDVICLDVGQNQMWAAQSMQISQDQRLLISGGMGAMGFSLPVAIGAYYQNPQRGKVLAIAGDGGLQMNIQELALLKRNRIPVKIIVMNNHSLGMIRHFQEMYFEGRYNATIKDYEAPDFCKIAAAYGIRTVNIKDSHELSSLKPLLSSDEPILIEIQLPQSTYVYPKLAINRPIEDQEPLLPRDELAGNMLVKPIGSDKTDSQA
ncbi:thiamine pyrophosphate-binding protein [Desulforamulus aeronauticus]|nr:thiamine pyrophosphate-binding protein [Desulforamulus aeronauticus]